MLTSFEPIPAHPGYFVSPSGQFRRGYTKIISTPRNAAGNLLFVVQQDGKRKWYLAHRIVAAVFLGDVTGKIVRFRNGDPTDIRVENLEIVGAPM